MTSPGGTSGKILRGKRNERFARFFGRYVVKMMTKSFRSVRLTAGSRDVLASLDASPRPLIVLLSHSSWWDPLVSLLLAKELVPSRSITAPMDRSELERFAFFRYLGVFGIDPDDPAALPPMVEYVMEVFQRETRPTLWITPQGNFADPRAPIRLRPGASAVAAEAFARLGGCDVIVAAIEYVFWEDKRPEVLIHLHPCTAETPSTPGWHRAATRAMQSAAATLAQAAISRDPSRFEILTGRDAPRIHPLFDAFLRLTGRQRALGEARQAGKEAHA